MSANCLCGKSMRLRNNVAREIIDILEVRQPRRTINIVSQAAAQRHGLYTSAWILKFKARRFFSPLKISYQLKPRFFPKETLFKRHTFPLTNCFSGKPRDGPPILSPKVPNAPGTPPPNRIRTKINYLLRQNCFGGQGGVISFLMRSLIFPKFLHVGRW